MCIFGENPNPLGVQFLYLALLGFKRKYPLHRFHEINLLLLIIKVFIYSSVLFYLKTSLTNILLTGRMGPLADTVFMVLPISSATIGINDWI